MNNSVHIVNNGIKSVQQSDDYGRKVDTNTEVSFRGRPIPEVKPKSNFKVSDSNEVISKINSMDANQKSEVSIEAVHYGDKGISDVKLTTGDIVPIETAIALAGNHMLAGYSTGKTVRGGRVLRSKPDPKNVEYHGIHSLPEF